MAGAARHSCMSKLLNPVCKMPLGFEEPSAEGYLSAKSFSGTGSMEGMRADNWDEEKGLGSWKGQPMLSCATISQPASKPGIPGLAAHPLACLWAYRRALSIVWLLSSSRIHFCEDAVTCRDTCQACRGAERFSGRPRVICDRAPRPETACGTK